MGDDETLLQEQNLTLIYRFIYRFIYRLIYRLIRNGSPVRCSLSIRTGAFFMVMISIGI